MDRTDRQVGRHQHQHFQAFDHLAGAVGVDGGHRAVVAGVHGLDHVEGLRPAALAHDDPVGPHAERSSSTRSRIVYSPAPSMFGGFVSSVTTCSWCIRNSVVSSIVTIRSLKGMKLLKMFSSVVLPVPVPPLTRMLRRSITQARRNVAAGVLMQFSLHQVVHASAAGRGICGPSASAPCRPGAE